MATHVIVLAAGEGKRMKSSLPKVAHQALGLTLVEWVDCPRWAHSSLENVVVVVGHGADVVCGVLPTEVTTALQEERLGTGHATQIGFDSLTAADPDDVVMVLYGDTPLLTTQLLSDLASLEPGESGRLISAHLEDATGYGRVVRDADGQVIGVVEHRGRVTGATRDHGDQCRHLRGAGWAVGEVPLRSWTTRTPRASITSLT